MEDSQSQSPVRWRELVNPGIELVFLLGTALCLWFALIAYRVLPAPSWLGLQGLPSSSGSLANMVLLIVCVFDYAAMLFALPIALNSPEGKFAGLAPEQKRSQAIRIRWAASVSTLLLAAFSFTALLGMSQSAAGFDWNRRWPLE